MATQTAVAAARTANDVLSEEVRALMGRRRMSATALAAALGKSQQSVSDRLRGHRSWSLEDLPALAYVFGVDANTLLPNLGKGLISTDPATEAYCAPAGQPRLRLVASNTSARSETTGDRHLSRPRLAAAEPEITRSPQINTLLA